MINCVLFQSAETQQSFSLLKRTARACTRLVRRNFSLIRSVNTAFLKQLHKIFFITVLLVPFGILLLQTNKIFVSMGNFPLSKNYTNRLGEPLFK